MGNTQMISLDTGKYLNKTAKILYFLTVCVITVTGFFNKYNLYEILKLNLLSVVLVSILIFYAKENQIKFIDNSINLLVIVGSSLFSLIFIMISVKYSIYNLWLVGPMVIAMLIDTNFGLSFHLLFSFILSVTAGYSMDNLMFNFILGALGCILAKYIMDLSKIGYVMIIFLSSNVTLIFIMNNFMTKKTMNVNVLYSVLSSILLFAIVFINFKVYQNISTKLKFTFTVPNQRASNYKKEDRQNIKFKLISKDKLLKIKNHNKQLNIEEQSFGNKERSFNNTLEQSQSLNVFKGVEEDILNIILNEDYLLLKQLDSFSEALYNRSKEISLISYKAALKIQANGKLTKAGGLYCKIGRTVSKEYIIEGVKLLEMHHFPQEVIDIVWQHNLKYGNPKSKEAAIVMLTDNIIASMDAMKNKKDSKPIPMNKLIDGIFTLRLTKSNLDESGLAITELKMLKEFYNAEFADHSKYEI